MGTNDSYYDVLGVDRATATPRLIDAGYKLTYEGIFNKYSGNSKKMEEELIIINRAHATLIDYKLKAEYDMLLDAQTKNTIEALRKQVQRQIRSENTAEQIVNSANNAVQRHKKRIRLLAIVLIFSVLSGSILYFYFAQKGSKSTPPAKQEPTKTQKKKTISN